MSKAQWIKENIKPGETYAGLILGKNGERDYHLVLLAGEVADVTFAKAGEWAKKVGGELPTRREQSLLFANCKEEFQPRWYWSSERHASYSDYAWCQGFSSGNQSPSDTDDKLRARAVRRLFL